MRMIPLAILGLLWVAVGAWSTGYWWTKSNDLELGDWLVLAVGAVGGPLSFVFFALPTLVSERISPTHEKKIIWRRRTSD